MFGTVVDAYPTGYMTLTNETCFKSKLNFISISANKNNELITVGDTVRYSGGVVWKDMFDNCSRCQKSCEISYAQQVINHYK
jgi:hypothetical protein